MLYAILAAVLVHTLVIPSIGYLLAEPPINDAHARLMANRFGDAIFRRGLESIMAIWFAVLGAAIGSFLNVVVYRLPLGRSLVRHGSFCPHCRVPIRASDNIPVIGWIKLRGRCRICRLPIAARYPAVEALMAAIFVLFFLVELSTDGANLPGRSRDAALGAAWIILDSRWNLIGIYLFQMMLLSIFVSASLIRYDRHPYPVRLIVFAWLMAVLLPAAWPFAHGWMTAYFGRGDGEAASLFAVPWDATAIGSTSSVRWYLAPMTPLVGLATGLAIGATLTAAAATFGRGPRQREALEDLVIGLTLAGAYLGWQGAGSVAWCLGGLLLAAGLLRRIWPALAYCPLLGWITVATATAPSGWRWLAELPFWPGVTDWRWWIVQTIAAVAVFVLAWRIGIGAPPDGIDSIAAPTDPDADGERDDRAAHKTGESNC